MRLVASTQPDTTEVCNHLQPKAIPLPSLFFLVWGNMILLNPNMILVFMYNGFIVSKNELVF